MFALPSVLRYIPLTVRPLPSPLRLPPLDHNNIKTPFLFGTKRPLTSKVSFPLSAVPSFPPLYLLYVAVLSYALPPSLQYIFTASSSSSFFPPLLLPPFDPRCLLLLLLLLLSLSSVASLFRSVVAHCGRRQRTSYTDGLEIPYLHCYTHGSDRRMRRTSFLSHLRRRLFLAVQVRSTDAH